MPRLRALLACVSITLAAIASDAGAQAERARPDSSPPRIVRLARPVEVPMRNAGSAAAPLPAVDVMVNGRGPFLFGIETGARFLVMTAEAANRAGVQSANAAPGAELHVDSITIGSALLGDVNVVVLPRSARGVDGLLGLPAFQNLLLTLDYPRSVVRIERDSLPRPNGSTILPLTRVSGFWALDVGYAGHLMTTILDTRSSGAFSLDPAVAPGLPWAVPPVVIGRAGGAGIPTTDVKGGTLAGDVALGSYRIQSPFLVLHRLPPDYPTAPRLGAVVLENFVVTLDQAHARLRLLRDGPPTFALPAPPHTG